jgi:hypothetical protein
LCAQHCFIIATKVHQTGKASYTLALAERITTVVVLKEKSIHQDTEKKNFSFGARLYKKHSYSHRRALFNNRALTLQ